MYIRKDAYAGSFYPADKQKLSAMIVEFIQSAKKELTDITQKPVALIAPHAGYIYSGPVAGYSYSLLPENTEIVIILAPSHRGFFNGAITTQSGIYPTPVGESRIAEEITSQLLHSGVFSISKELDELEHSLEVQLPFVQTQAPHALLVPVIIGSTSYETLREISDALFKSIEHSSKRICIIISTDLSHYHQYDEANAIDEQFCEALQTFDEAKLHAVLAEGKAEACGHASLVVGIALAKKIGGKQVKILKHLNSGDTAGDKYRVVGYLSAAVF